MAIKVLKVSNINNPSNIFPRVIVSDIVRQSHLRLHDTVNVLPVYYSSSWYAPVSTISGAENSRFQV